MGGARGVVVQPVEAGQQVGAQGIHLGAEAGDAPLAYRLGVNVADDVVAGEGAAEKGVDAAHGGRRVGGQVFVAAEQNVGVVVSGLLLAFGAVRLLLAQARLRSTTPL